MQMGLTKKYENVKNPFRWVTIFEAESIKETKTDFFQGKPRNYSKVVSDNGFDDL
jgi:ribonucleoside-diphosphate reductase beta chain